MNNKILNFKVLIGIIAVLLLSAGGIAAFFLYNKPKETPAPFIKTPVQLVFLNKKDESVDVLALDGQKIKTIYKQEGFNDLVGARYCKAKNILGTIERSFVGSTITSKLILINLNTNTKTTVDTKTYELSNQENVAEIGYIDNFSPDCEFITYTVAKFNGCSTGVYSLSQNKTLNSNGCHNLFWSPDGQNLFNINREIPDYSQYKFGFISKDNLVSQLDNPSKNLIIASYDLSKITVNWPKDMHVLPGGFFVGLTKIVLFPIGPDLTKVYETDPVVFDFKTEEVESYAGIFRPREDISLLNFVDNEKVFVDTSGFIANEKEDFFYEFVGNWYKQTDSVEINIHSKDYLFAGWAE